jgi:Na+-driven multidrug efflux pump
LALKQGIAGVALATIISQAVSGLYCRQRMHKRIRELLPSKGEFRFDRKSAGEMVRIGVPAAFSSAVVTFSVMLIQRAVNSYGSTVLAAYTAEEKVGQICFCLSYSIGLATGVFIGQNTGAGLTDRVKQGLKAGTAISLIYHIAIAGIMLLFCRQLISIFTTEEAVIEIAVEVLRINALASPLLGLNFVFQNFLRNVSDVKPTIWMSSAEVLSRGIMPYVLGARFGYRGVWWATPIGWLLSFLIGLWRYLSGKWCSS